MNKFRYSVILTVEVEAFDASDAWDVLQDNFGIADEGDIVVVDCEYQDLND